MPWIQRKGINSDLAATHAYTTPSTRQDNTIPTPLPRTHYNARGCVPPSLHESISHLDCRGSVARVLLWFGSGLVRLGRCLITATPGPAQSPDPLPLPARSCLACPLGSLVCPSPPIASLRHPLASVLCPPRLPALSSTTAAAASASTTGAYIARRCPEVIAIST